ncbi:MAG: ATP-binding protein [Bacteroidetes bacterium]|nr:ATP-binding protein [Bacteroidota bacterium]
MIQRIVEKDIKAKLFKGKVILLMGPRQVGKTTLLKMLDKGNHSFLRINADEIEDSLLFENISAKKLRQAFGKAKLIIVDEAQRIPDIGLKLKIISDELKDIQVIATGSSSFDLANKVNEPLTGRKWEYMLYPVSFNEMVSHHGLLTEKKMLNHRLVYGYYPDVVTSTGEEKEILKLLTDSYLYKDILIWNKINKTDKIVKLLQSLAFQVGHQVSYNEIGKKIGLDSHTVESYIDLLEKSFVIFRLGTFSRNLRNELTKTRKIYFYDNGIRNAVISNYNPIELRDDIGALWENFLMSERMKHTAYNRIFCNRFFWRNKNQQEIDYIEEREGKLFAFEFKWNKTARVKFPASFMDTYKKTETAVITPANFDDFIAGS